MSERKESKAEARSPQLNLQRPEKFSYWTLRWTSLSVGGRLVGG